MKKRPGRTLAALLSAGIMWTASAVPVFAFPVSPSNLKDGEFSALTQLAQTKEVVKTDDGRFSYNLSRDPHLCAQITAYHGEGGTVRIPDIAGKIRVTGTGIDFSGRDDLTAVQYDGFANPTVFADNYENCSKLKTASIGTGLSDEFLKWYFPDGISDAEYYERKCILKKGLFAGCAALEAVTLPDTSGFKNSSTVGEGVFADCKALPEIEIKGNWIVEADAFLGCTALKKVTFSDEIREIGSYALGYVLNDDGSYEKYDGLTICGVTGTAAETYAKKHDIPFEPVPVSEKQIIATGECGAEGSKLTWTLDSGGVLIIAGEGKMADWPDNQVTYKKTVPWAEYLDEIKKAVIGEGVTHIGYHAFADCKALSDITIPESVTSVSLDAFYGTPWLEAKREESPFLIINGILLLADVSTPEITVPAGVVSIAGYVFANRNDIVRIILPESVRSISASAFIACTALKSIEIPDGVTAIAADTFSSCKSLESIVLPESVSSIGAHAFRGCEKLAKITILNPDCEIWDQYVEAWERSDGMETITNYTKTVPGEPVQYVFGGTICGYSGSTAEAYAKKYNRRFEALEPADTFAAQYAVWKRSALDDAGMFSGIAAANGAKRYFISACVAQDTQEEQLAAYSSDTADKPLKLGLNLPLDDCAVFFTKHKGLDADAIAVCTEYYPNNNLAGKNTEQPTGEPDAFLYAVEFGSHTLFRLYDNLNTGDPARMRSIMTAAANRLRAEELITGFYLPGQMYRQERLSVPYLTGYSEKALYGNAAFDPEAVQAYLAEKQLACTIRTKKKGEKTYYSVVPDQPLDFAAHLALAVQLYRDLKLMPYADVDSALDSSFPPMGADLSVQNVRGDISGDGEADVSDAVLLARFCAEDQTVRISTAGMKNADVNADGSITTADVIAILRIIAKL